MYFFKWFFYETKVTFVQDMFYLEHYEYTFITSWKIWKIFIRSFHNPVKDTVNIC